MARGDGRPDRSKGSWLWKPEDDGRGLRPADRARLHWLRIRRRWVVVLLCVLLAGAGALAWTTTRSTTYTGRAALTLREATAGGSHRSPETDAALASGYADFFNLPATQTELRRVTGAPPDTVASAQTAAAGPVVYINVVAADPDEAQKFATAMASAFRDEVRDNLGADLLNSLGNDLTAAHNRVAALPPNDPGLGGAQYRVTVIQGQISDLETTSRTNQLQDMQLTGGVTTNGTNAARVVGLALAAGLVVGLVLAWVLGQFARHLNGPIEIRNKLDLETVAVVTGRGRRDRGSGPQADLAAVSSLAGVIDTSGARTVVLTAPRAGATARIAESVALLRAQQGLRTLLVQADVEQAAADHTAASTGLADVPGVTDVLAEGHTARLDGKVVDDDRGLLVMPPGSRTQATYEVFSRPALTHLLRSAAATTDLVLVDAPPVIDAPESQLVASLADLTLVVLEHGVTRTKDAVEAVEALRQAHARLGGAVIARGFPTTGSGSLLAGPWRPHAFGPPASGEVRIVAGAGRPHS